MKNNIIDNAEEGRHTLSTEEGNNNNNEASIDDAYADWQSDKEILLLRLQVLHKHMLGMKLQKTAETIKDAINYIKETKL